MRSAWGVTIALLALTIVMTWPLAMRLQTSLPGDYGDPLLVTWAIGWVSRTLTASFTQPHMLGELWNANIFYPEPQTLAFSEHFIGQTVLVLPVYWLTRNLILCYNVAFLATFVLSGVGTFLLTRSITHSVLGGIVAAAVMVFNEYRLVYEVSHLHVLSIHWFPFALFGFHRYVVTDSRWALAIGVLSLVALNLSSVYYMAYCTPFVAAFVLAEMVRLHRWRELRVWLELWAAAAVVAVVTLPFLLPYIEVQRRLAIVRTPHELTAFSATLDHYRAALPGLIVPVALSLAALAARTRQQFARMIPLVVFLFLSVWLSLGPVVQWGDRDTGIPGLYGVLYEHVPGFNSLRVPARFAMLFFFFLAMLAGVGSSRIATWAPRLVRPLIAAALVVYLWQMRPAALPLDQPLHTRGLESPPTYLTPSPTLPSIYHEVLALSSDAVLLELPFGDLSYDLRYMFFAATHGRRLVNGYSGVFPPSYLARRAVLAQPWLDPAKAAQALAGATHIIVHRAAWLDDTGTKVAAWLEGHGAMLVGSAADALIYEVNTPERLALITQ